MIRDGYDVMQVCLNGHRITDMAASFPQHRKAFCAECGAKTIDACPTCAKSIPGFYRVDGFITAASEPVPKYCVGCGVAYPWQQAALDSLMEILGESDLSEEDVKAVGAALPDIVASTPRTDGAAMRLGRLFSKLGKPIYDVAIKVVSDVASETAKKTLGLK